MFEPVSMGSSGVQQSLNVSLMKTSKAQEQAVMSNLMEGIKETPQPAPSRALFSTGHKVDLVA